MRNFIYALVCVSLISSLAFFAGRGQAADPPKPSYTYQIVVITPGGSRWSKNLESSNTDLEKIFSAADLSIFPEDKITAIPDPKMGIGGVITVRQAPAITIIDGKKPTVYRSWQTTVGKLLSEKKIELGTDDKISSPPEAQIFDGSQITITRVAITTLVETAAIPFSIEKQDDPNLNWGRTRVTPGTNGQKQVTYLVRREDGVEVSRILQSSQVLSAPVAEIDYTGTKVIIISSVSGRATMTPVSTYIVSPNFPRGSVVRITNKSNGKQIFGIVNATWGTASPPAGVVLDLAPKFLSQLGCPSFGCSSVTVDEIEQ